MTSPEQPYSTNLEPSCFAARRPTTNLVSSKLIPAFQEAILRVVLHGKEGVGGLMPPLASALNDEQVAAVLSYIRRSWGHSAPAVSPAAVKETRGVNKLRKTPWTGDELKRFSAPPNFGVRAPI